MQLRDPSAESSSETSVSSRSVVAVAGKDPWVDRRLGKYRLGARLGKGGMGVVYEATDRLFRRRVAIKLLTPALAEDPATLRRFQREARAAARLQHPNVATVHDIDQRDGVVYLVMELVAGRASIQQVIQTKGALPWPLAT